MTLDAWIAARTDARREMLAQCAEPERVMLSLGDEVEALAARDPASAVSVGRALIEVAQSLGVPRAEIRASRATAVALAAAGCAEDSIALADSAALLADQHGLALDAARARVASLAPRTMLGRTDEALRIGTAARDVLCTLGELIPAARADFNLANIHKARGENVEAVARLQLAEPALRNELIPAGFIQNALGENLVYLDRFDEAEACFRKADAILSTTPATMALAVVRGNTGDLFAREGRMQDALSAYSAARALLPPSAVAHRVRLQIEEAELLALLGATQDATQTLRETLEEANTLGLSAERIRASVAQARLFLSMTRMDDAERLLRFAILEVERSGDSRSIREAMIVLAALLLSRGECAKALELTTRIVCDEHAAPSERARAMIIEADALRRLQRTPEALRAAQNAQAIARGSSNAVLEADALLAEANIARESSGASESIPLLERAVVAVERIRGTLASERFRADWLGSRLRPYEDLALDLLSAGTSAAIARAFDVVEQAKSRALLDAMMKAVDRTLTTTSTADETALAAVRAQLNALYASDFQSKELGARRGSAALPDLIRVAEQRYAELADGTRRGLQAMLAKPSTGAAIQAHIPEHVVLIEYFAIGEELLVFVITKNTIHVTRAIDSMSALDELVSRANFHLRRGARQGNARATARHTSAAISLMKSLGESLIAPLIPHICRANRLVIVPHGALHALPFAALVVDGKHLIEQFEIMTAPSASVAFSVAAPSHSNPATLAPLVIHVADARAPEITREGERVAESIRSLAGSCDVLRGDDATADAFAANCAQRPLLHVACHGRFVEALPAASGLRLADRWFPIRDILALELCADLVVLSACETGRHAVQAGDELNGLARAFIAAGAKRLLVCLWAVSDTETAELQTEFHRLRTTAIRLHGSLLDADCSALRTSLLNARDSGVQLPLWAPFSLLGQATEARARSTGVLP